MNNAARLLGIATLAAGLTFSGLVALPATAQGGLYDNCTNFNNTYPHGVGRRHAHDHTSGTPVTNFKHSNKLFKRAMNHNRGLDGDGDKVACEKR